MKYYEKLRRLGCITRQDLTQIVGSQSSVASVLLDYQRKGYIERIHRNLYAVMDVETEQPVLSRYQIGNRLFSDACISHHSAFEVWGCADRLLSEVYVATKSRFTDFKYNGVFYRYVNRREMISTAVVADTLVTSPEQTIVDSIHSFEKIAGLEEVARCIMRGPVPNADALLQCLERYGNGYLYQKCGYILEQLQEYVKLPKSFYRECKEHCPTTVRYLVKESDRRVYNREWGIYTPVSIDSVIVSGGIPEGAEDTGDYGSVRL